MVKVLIQRDPSDIVTFGKLYLPWINHQPDIYTIELPWKDNQHYISCIPAGIYTCIPYSSEKHKNTWEVTKVPGDRTGIHFDIANYASNIINNDGEIIHKCELLGCIALGFGIDESVPMITNSENALGYLRTMINVNESFELEIRDA